MQGSHFCDCLNWKGVCIYQELHDNGNKAKEQRKTYTCKVCEKVLYPDDVLLIKFEAPHKLVIDLARPGSFIFIRSEENVYFDVPISILESDIETNIISIMIEIRGIKTKQLLNIGSFIFIRSEENVYFDVPISILESDIETNIISIMIEIRGIKTKQLLNIESGGNITIRGPYWNGVFGLKNIRKQKNNEALVIARGIGMAPMMPVISRLVENGNTVTLILDKQPFNDIYVSEWLDKLNIVPQEMNLIEKGELSPEGKVAIKSIVKYNNISLIHIAGADILTYSVIDFLDSLDRKDIDLSCCNNFKMCCGEGVCGSCTAIHIAGADILTYSVIDFLDSLDRKDIDLSCCNNFKMCCGEGVCGSCTARFSGHRVKRFCKVQASPRGIFEGKRFCKVQASPRGIFEGRRLI